MRLAQWTLDVSLSPCTLYFSSHFLSIDRLAATKMERLKPRMFDNMTQVPKPKRKVWPARAISTFNVNEMLVPVAPRAGKTLSTLEPTSTLDLRISLFYHSVVCRANKIRFERNSAESPLLRLPAELRNQIYGCVDSGAYVPP